MANNLLDFDFGFTAVDENELEAVQKASSKIESTSSKAEDLEDKLNNLYNAILPLLSNLKKNMIVKKLIKSKKSSTKERIVA